jgi:hypothetical protein
MVSADPTLPDCTWCGCQVVIDADEGIEVCIGCDRARAMGPVVNHLRRQVREAVAEVRRLGPILCPSCTRRRCDLCHASGCTCPSSRHPRRPAK